MLDQYAGTVLSAYAVSLVLLIGIVWASYARAAKVRRQLEEVERHGR